jgi:hypothetical protein
MYTMRMIAYFLIRISFLTKPGVQRDRVDY